MGLFSPKWMSKNVDDALRAVEALTDEKKLAPAAQNAPHGRVRLAALKKTSDQAASRMRC